ncbi:MAG: homoserine kinase [Clostridiaceae bacterium]|nr:homoserine kinase [Clostridiaceae bacterium]
MIKVSVPATTANIGPGFDCIGMALTLYNEIQVEETNKDLIIEVTGRDAENIEKDENNLVYKSMLKVFDKIGYRPKGLKIKQHNGIPMARGLGSSAACIVGGVTAANKLCGSPLNHDQLLQLATEIEGHPDNVAPALFGGVVVSSQDKAKTSYVRFPVPESLKFIVAIPAVSLSTKAARGVLPENILFEDAVFNVGKASLLVAALMSGELDKLDVALQDRLHQPYRVKLMDSLEKIFNGCRDQNLNNVFLSGAGPSIIYLNWKKDEEEKGFYSLFKEMSETWEFKTLKGDNKGIV